MDINIENRSDWERRRKIRLAQVRDQSKELAKTIRERVHSAVETQLKQHETIRNIREHKYKSLALSKLKSDFNYLVQDVGSGYSVASFQPDPNIVLAEKRLVNRCKAISRGLEADKRQKQIQDKQHIDVEIKERQKHFNKTVEKIRSTLISTIRPNADSGDKNIQNINKYNECFLIPSQVTLNESNIINWNVNKKTSKPWSMVINSEENKLVNLQQLATHDDNKENEQDKCKLTKLETDVKNYEILVTELNKLSAEEQNIRNKIFTNNWKFFICLNVQEVLELSKNNEVSSNSEKEKYKKNIEVKHSLDERTKYNITEKQIDDSSTYISSLSSSNSSEQTKKFTKKNVHFETKANELNNIQRKSKLINNKKPANERPLKNINNTLQRIKMKKQMLLKEISTDARPNIKKLNIVSSTSKLSPLHKRCSAGNDIPKESSTMYAELPDSFYSSQLETLKEQILDVKSKPCDTKLNTSLNIDLMKYINLLLKMTPLEVDNLSISSCSSISLEESILQSKHNMQYYSEMLNCISKCLNADISDINEDIMLNSPENVNLINRLQGLTNYYQEKILEMKNICDESTQTLNDKVNVENLERESIIPSKNNSINKSSDSSVDGDFILRHLNTLLLKKGLIQSDKEWPMFESINNNDDVDDNRSLTDQLLDISTEYR
ncbi:centrosomal protein of 295 kDa-like [Sipha flava]|uniref:Centrosomal protein of 295 kDa-like n=1 Tax=Sipha flava TaxID=143950 RepID=A0A8B8GHV5_9HEMI|nr:centrosomal protein of 295 kDa-like [Sipha flava]